MIELLWFLLIGLAAGWLAGQFTRGDDFGLVGNMVVGVIGSFMGGLVIRMLGFTKQGAVAELITATGGAILFLFLLRLIKQRRG